ncbi:Nicotinamidase-related amidase [Paenibacillus sp. yr247]|uniref:isochorismatase family protein n=1 Tax=Paenibacillus sp. yr247 TaxID=1761880 RepID=UPI0008822763|nr:isochorismatase family protein [Paenibacillus sp. yr247]SDO25163.1 Nicotinamidase-related amidase [Paenibacillus sp. yr247]
MTNVKTAGTEVLDAEKTALVVIDLQNGIVGLGGQLAPNSAQQVVGQASRLVEAFTNKGAFVVLVRVSTLDGKDWLHPKTDAAPHAMQWPEGWDNLIPELEGFLNAHVVTKRQWGAFFGTDLDLQLRRRGIDTIVLCGISTSIGVDTTATEAFQHGYHQVFVEDAMTATAKEEHEYVVKTKFPRMGKIRTTEEVVSMLK